MIRPEDYTRWRTTQLGAITEQLEEKIIFTLAGDLHEQKVLDIGCGDGTYAISACQQGADVIGVDLSAAMLIVARRRAGDCPRTVQCCLASAESLPFDSETFDIVIAVTALCFVEDPRRAVQEAARVLRPGGRLIIGELGRYSLWALSRRIRGWFGASTWRKARFWSMAGLQQLVGQAGLRFHSARGCVYYPPLEPVACLMVKAEHALSRLGSFGAAFLAVRADKI
jgi:ubiquinone/menaquinone biosynthesis C-methylase UbiE